MYEYEIKVLLTEEEYNALCSNIQNIQETVIQTNYYYDTLDMFFNKKGTTYRVRKVEDEFIATIKEHTSKLFGHNCSKEISKKVKGINDIAFFGDTSLILLGKLITERRVCYEKNNCQIVLDKNIYLGNTDYELEIEYAKDMYAWANEVVDTIFEFLQIICFTYESRIKRFFASNSLSKSSRFFKKLIQRNNKCV